MFHFFWRSSNCVPLAGLCGAFFCWRHFWKRLRLSQASVLGCREWVLPWGFWKPESFKTQTLGQLQITWLRLCPALSAGGLLWFGRPACQRLGLKHWHVTRFFASILQLSFWVGNAFGRMRLFAVRWHTECERLCRTLLASWGFQRRGPERRATGFFWRFQCGNRCSTVSWPPRPFCDGSFAECLAFCSSPGWAMILWLWKHKKLMKSRNAKD